jgi:signal transduction histidine kinase/CheY-like chemotaxis protein
VVCAGAALAYLLAAGVSAMGADGPLGLSSHAHQGIAPSAPGTALVLSLAQADGESTGSRVLLRSAVGLAVVLVLMVVVLSINIALRRRAERDLRGYRTHLERLVEDRTMEVRQSNRQLEQEIVERRRAEEILLRREAILEAMEFAAGQFLEGHAWEEDIDGVLVRLGESAKLSRVNIVENRRGKSGSLLLFRRYEWRSQGTESALAADSERVTYEDEGIESWRDRLVKGETIAGNRSAFPDTEQTLLADRQIKAVAVVPVFVSGEWWGFMEFDDCEAEREWPVLELEALRTAANILGQAILRERNEEERDRMAERVARAQKLQSLGVLTGGIAHDFNNILTGILGNADIALSELPHSSSVTTSVQHIKDAAIRASKLTGQMLACSGKGRFVFEQVDLNATLRNMTNMLGPVIRDGIGLTYELDEDIPPIQADATMLKQMAMGLVANASEAIGDREEGAITISTGVLEADAGYLAGTYPGVGLSEGNYVFMRVQDNGSGMDEDMLGRVFEPFFTTKFAGRGLGLAAILGIVKGHAGAIRLASEAGEGTAFTVLFPLAPDREEPVVDEIPVVPAEITGQTVLVIDDEESIRNVTRLMLEKSGFEVLTADDGPEGLALFRERPGDIAVTLLDLTMPGMNGDEVMKQILGIQNGACVLLTSGYKEEDVRHRFDVDGMTGFIHKPFELTSLVDQIRSVMTEVGVAEPPELSTEPA